MAKTKAIQGKVPYWRVRLKTPAAAKRKATNSHLDRRSLSTSIPNITLTKGFI